MSPQALVLARTFRQFEPAVARIEDEPLLPPDTPLEFRSACDTLWNRRGKRLRPHLVHWFGEWYGIPADALTPFAWAAEALHTATLLHDDVIDESSKRRGGPSANALFGNTTAVLSGDYLLSHAVGRVVASGRTDLATSFCKTMQDLTEGELLQNRLRHRLPTWSELQTIAEKKTVSLFYWCASVGPRLDGEKDLADLHRFVSSLGKLFQYGDDLLDVVGNSEKGVGVDFKGGLVNAVAWDLIHQVPDLKEQVKAHWSGEQGVPPFQEAFRLPATREKVQERLRAYQREAVLALTRLPPHSVRGSLRGLTDTLYQRYVELVPKG